MATNGKTESESRKHLDEDDRAAVSFVISMGDDCVERPRSTPPKRLRNYQRKTVSRQELEQKQVDAEIRRKEKEKEMLNRVIQKREEVQKLNRNFNTLLEQDAKRQSAEGTGDIPNLSPQQLKEKFHSVNKAYMKMAKSIGANTQLPN